MARHLFIVSRHHIRMHAYLQERFQGDDKVELILDRRMAQRRSSVGVGAYAEERRRSDRRSRPELDIELRARSHVILTLPEPKDVEPRPN